MASDVMYIVGELATTSILNQHHPIYILTICPILKDKYSPHPTSRKLLAGHESLQKTTAHRIIHLWSTVSIDAFAIQPHEFRLRHPCGWRDWKIGRGKGTENFLLDFALEKYQDIYTHEVSSTCLPNMSFTRSQQTCKHGRKKTFETSRRTKNYRQLNNFESWRGDMVFPMGEFPDCVSNTKWSELRSYIYR